MSITPDAANTLRRALATAVVVPVTPYLADGNPDWDTYAALAARLIDAGISVITPNGNTGEFYALSQAEARQALETAAKVASTGGEHGAEVLAARPPHRDRDRRGPARPGSLRCPANPGIDRHQSKRVASGSRCDGETTSVGGSPMTTTSLPRIAVIGTGGTISSLGASSLDVLDYPDFGQKLTRPRHCSTGFRRPGSSPTRLRSRFARSAAPRSARPNGSNCAR